MVTRKTAIKTNTTINHEMTQALDPLQDQKKEISETLKEYLTNIRIARATLRCPKKKEVLKNIYRNMMEKRNLKCIMDKIKQLNTLHLEINDIYGIFVTTYSNLSKPGPSLKIEKVAKKTICFLFL